MTGLTRYNGTVNQEADMRHPNDHSDPDITLTLDDLYDPNDPDGDEDEDLGNEY